jgi:hypothetical protein
MSTHNLYVLVLRFHLPQLGRDRSAHQLFPLLNSVVCQYIELLANTGRTSEIPRVMHLLIDQRLPSHRPWKAALRSHSDPIAAARFLIGFRADLPEPLLIRLVDQLVSSEWGEGVASREETMKEVRSMLEEAFGADVWAKVDATVERGKAKV